MSIERTVCSIAAFLLISALVILWIKWRDKRTRLPPTRVRIANAFLVTLMVATTVVAILRYAAFGPKDVVVSSLRHQVDAKRALVFIHGWTGTDGTWKDAAATALQDPRLSSFDILTVTYPTLLSGQGRSVTEIAASILEQMHRSAYNRQVYIIAHSLGGVIARRMILLEAARGEQSIAAVASAGAPYLGVDAA